MSTYKFRLTTTLRNVEARPITYAVILEYVTQPKGDPFLTEICTYLLNAIIAGDEHVEHAILDDVEVVAVVSLPDQVLSGLRALLEHRVQHLRKRYVSTDSLCL